MPDTQFDPEIQSILDGSAPQRTARQDFDPEIAAILAGDSAAPPAFAGVMERMTAPAMRTPDRLGSPDPTRDLPAGHTRKNLATGRTEILRLNPATAENEWVDTQTMAVGSGGGEYVLQPTTPEDRRENRKVLRTISERAALAAEAEIEGMRAKKAREILDAGAVPRVPIMRGVSVPVPALTAATDVARGFGYNVASTVAGLASGAATAVDRVLPEAVKNFVLPPDLAASLRVNYPQYKDASPLSLLAMHLKEKSTDLNVNQLLRDNMKDGLLRMLGEEIPSQVVGNAPLTVLSAGTRAAAGMLIPLKELGKESFKRTAARFVAQGVGGAAPEAAIEAGSSRLDVYQDLRARGFGHEAATRKANDAFGNVFVKDMATLFVTNSFGPVKKLGDLMQQQAGKNLIKTAVVKAAESVSSRNPALLKMMSKKSVGAKIVKDVITDASGDFVEEVDQAINQEIERKRAAGEDTSAYKELLENPEVIRAGIVGAFMGMVQGQSLSAPTLWSDVRQGAFEQMSTRLGQTMAADTTPIESMVTNQGLIDQTLTGQQIAPEVTTEVTPEVMAQFEQDVAALGEAPPLPDQFPDPTWVEANPAIPEQFPDPEWAAANAPLPAQFPDPQFVTRGIVELSQEALAIKEQLARNPKDIGVKATLELRLRGLNERMRSLLDTKIEQAYSDLVTPEEKEQLARDIEALDALDKAITPQPYREVFSPEAEHNLAIAQPYLRPPFPGLYTDAQLAATPRAKVAADIMNIPTAEQRTQMERLEIAIEDAQANVARIEASKPNGKKGADMGGWRRQVSAAKQALQDLQDTYTLMNTREATEGLLSQLRPTTPIIKPMPTPALGWTPEGERRLPTAAEMKLKTIPGKPTKEGVRPSVIAEKSRVVTALGMENFPKTSEAIKRNASGLQANANGFVDIAIALLQDLAAMGQRGVQAFVEQARQLFDRSQIAQIEKNFGSLEALYERAVADSQMEVQTSEGQKVTLTAPDLVAEANAAKSEANFAIEQLKEREMTSAARRDAIASVKQDLQRKLDGIASREGQDVTQREAPAPVQATETQGDIYGQKFVYLNSGITLGNVVQSIDAILKQAGKPTLSERLGITYDNPSTAELVRALKKAIAGLGAKVEDTAKKLVKKFGLETPVAQILAKLLHDYKPPKGIKFHGPKERKQTYITQANDALQDAIEGTDAAIAQAMPAFQMAAPVPVGAPTESVTRRFPSVLRKLGINFVEIANRINSPSTRSQRSEEYKKTTRAINAFTAARERFTRIFSSAYEAMLDLALVDPARARLVQFMMGLSTLADGGKGRRLTMAEMQAMTAPGMWNEAAQKAYDTARDAADAASKAMIESVDVDLKLGLQEMDRLIQTQNVLMAKTSAALAAAEKVVNQAQSDLEADPGNADKGQATNRAVAAYRAARTAHEDTVRGMDELKTVREKKIETAKQLTEVFGNKAYWPLSRNGNYRYDVWADGADGKPIRLAMFLSDERFDRNDPGSAQRLQTFLGSQIALASLTNKDLRDAVLAGKHKWGDLETRFRGQEGDGEGMVRDLSDPTEAAASNLGMDALVLEHTLNNTSIANKIGRHISDLDGAGTGSLAAIAEMVRTTNSADFAELHFRYRQGVPGWSMDPLMSMEAFMRWGSNFYANNMEGRNLDNALKNLSQEGARARGGEYFADDWTAAIDAAKDAKNPAFNPIVSKILEAGFIYGLGGNPAFMLQQATQQGLLIRWYLRHYYGSEAPVVKALAQGNKIAGKLLGFKVIDLEGYTPAQLETHLNKVVTVEDMLPLAGGNPKLAAEMKVNVVSALLHATQSGSLSPQNFIEPDSKRLDAPATSTSGAALAARAGWQSTKNALSYVASKTEKLNRIATTAATAALATRYGTFGANDATGWSFNKTADPDEITLFANEVSDLLNIGGKRGQRPSYQMGTWTKIPMQFKRFMIEQAVIIHNVGMLDLQRAKAAKDTNIVKQWWAYTKPQITQGMATYLIAGTQAAMPVYAMAKVMGAILGMIGMIWPDLEDEIERDYIDAVGRETRAMLKSAAERMGLSPDMSDRLSKRAWFTVVNGPLWNLVTGTNISSSLRPSLVFAPPGAGPMETMGHLIMGPMLSRPFAVADAIRGNEPWHLALKGAMPNSLQNLVGGAVMATTGRTWTKKPIPVDWIDAAAKSLGVTTTSLAMVMSKNAEKTEAGTELGDLKKEIRKMGENFVERSDSFTLSETEKEELRKKITQYNIIARRRGEKTLKYRDVRPTKPGKMQKREDELFFEAGVKNPRRK